MGEVRRSLVMDRDPRATAREIEQTRDELARKVDELVVRAKVEAGEVGRKAAIGGAVLVGILLLGAIAKRLVRN
ncbi:MAG: DUF3618 domain-containing protein [Actinomycetota bacterium]|nr:DUF3618 domain-containing protein [Actinomycetota bacterium]